MKRAFCAVAVLALACLLIRAARVGVAGDYVDPIGKITAQDEALYAHSAIYMARNGQWLTPMFMGRFALYKPPLLAWAAGFSARIAGVSRLALRFPVALACCLALGLIFLWAAELRSWQAGVCAARAAGVQPSVARSRLPLYDRWTAGRLLHRRPLLPLLRPLAGIEGRPVGLRRGRGRRHPHQERGRRAAADGPRALLAGRAAPLQTGLLASLPGGRIIARRWRRPGTSTSSWSTAAGSVTEHIGVEILGYGGAAPPQTSTDSHLFFYLSRLVLLDPVLVAAALVALPAFASALWKRSAAATLLACWAAVVLLSVFGWQYRNASYLLPLIPMLAILATSLRPGFPDQDHSGGFS